MKNIFDEAYQNERNRIMGITSQNNEREGNRLSFQDLKGLTEAQGNIQKPNRFS